MPGEEILRPMAALQQVKPAKPQSPFLLPVFLTADFYAFTAQGFPGFERRPDRSVYPEAGRRTGLPAAEKRAFLYKFFQTSQAGFRIFLSCRFL